MAVTLSTVQREEPVAVNPSNVHFAPARKLRIFVLLIILHSSGVGSSAASGSEFLSLLWEVIREDRRLTTHQIDEIDCVLSHLSEYYSSFAKHVGDKEPTSFVLNPHHDEIANTWSRDGSARYPYCSGLRVSSIADH